MILKMEFKGTHGKWSCLTANAMGVPKIIYVGDETIFQCYNTFGCDDAKYNALLISKAPEMLEMLQKCLCEFLDYSTTLSQVELAKDINKIIKEATEL